MKTDKKIILLNTLLALTLSSSFTIYYLFIRLGFKIDYKGVLISYSLCLTLILLPEVIAHFNRLKNNLSHYVLQGLICLFLISLFSLFGFFKIHFNSLIALSTTVIIIGLFVFQSFKIFEKKHVIYTIVFFIFSVCIAAFTYGIDFLNPLFIEKIIYKGVLMPDNIFNISIANNFKNFNSISLGFNNLNYFPYHFGSQVIFGSLSSFLNLDTITFYNLAYPIVFIPLFFKFFLATIISILREYSDKVIIIIGLFLIYFNRIFYNNDIGLHVFPFNSESYLLGLILFFYFLILIKYFIEEWNNLSNIKKLIVLYVVFPIILLIISITKISLGYFVLVTIFYVFFRSKLIFKHTYFLSFIFSFFLFLILFKLISYPNSEKLSLIHTLQVIKWFLSHLLSYYFILVLLMVLWVKNNLKEGKMTLKYFFYENSEYNIELVVLISLFGLLPSLLWSMADNWLYFTDVQSWVCFIILIPIIIKLNFNIKWIKYTSIIIIICLSARFINLSIDIIKNNYIEKKEILTMKSEKEISSIIKNRIILITGLQNISNEKFNTNVKIEVCKNDTIWRLFNKNQEYIPFLIPAISGKIVYILDFPIKLDMKKYNNRIFKSFLQKDSCLNCLNISDFIKYK